MLAGKGWEAVRLWMYCEAASKCWCIIHGVWSNMPPVLFWPELSFTLTAGERGWEMVVRMIQEFEGLLGYCHLLSILLCGLIWISLLFFRTSIFSKLLSLIFLLSYFTVGWIRLFPLSLPWLYLPPLDSQSSLVIHSLFIKLFPSCYCKSWYFFPQTRS